MSPCSSLKNGYERGGGTEIIAAAAEIAVEIIEITSARFVACAASRRLRSNHMRAISAFPAEKLRDDRCRETASSPNSIEVLVKASLEFLFFPRVIHGMVSP